jgi:DNA-binding CsgD family transcriptional regulator
MPAELTWGEQRVADRLASGATNRQIARALSLSEDTIKSHVKAILRKLNVPDRTAAAVRIREKSEREAAVTLVRVAGDHYRQSRLACARIVVTAHQHGLTVADLHTAAVLPEELINRMLKEATAP